MNQFLMVLYIGFGGFFGAIGRYGLSLFAKAYLKEFSAVGTLIANLLGSFCLGILASFLLQQSKSMTEIFYPMLGIGFLGAFTTFSTFSVESITLLKSGQLVFALVNIFANVIGSLVLAFLGLKLGENFIKG